METVVGPPRHTRAQSITTITSLYELIEAVQKAVGPENDELVVSIVMDLLRSGRIKFLPYPGVSHCN
jgi:hypothetical protein